MLNSHISTCFNKDTLGLFMLCIMLVCQLYHVVFIIVSRFILLLFDFHSSFDHLLFDFGFPFDSLLSLFVVQRKDSILILDCITGISIPLYMKYLFILDYASQINIIHQTAPTLS
jgi:hypothetical protein